MHRTLVATATMLATAVTALVTTVGLAAPGNAIIGGQPDTTHSNVGVLLPTAASPVARWCGVTPVAPDVVVLAGHCAALRLANFGETEGDITFDPRFLDSLGDRESGWAYTGSYPTYHGTLAAHPLYNPHSSGYDVAVMVLDEPVTGFDVEALPAAGLLDDLKAAGSLREQSMTVVGYGTTARLPSNVFVGGGYRQYAEQTLQSLGNAIVKHQERRRLNVRLRLRFTAVRRRPAGGRAERGRRRLLEPERLGATRRARGAVLAARAGRGDGHHLTARAVGAEGRRSAPEGTPTVGLHLRARQ